MDVTRHDTNFALVWLDNTWAVWSDQASFVLRFHDRLDLDHVKGWNALRDADNEVHLSLDSLQDGVGGERRWNVDDGGFSIGGRLGFGHGTENRQAKMLSAGLALIDSTDDLGAVGESLLRVERTLVNQKTGKLATTKKICHL